MQGLVQGECLGNGPETSPELKLGPTYEDRRPIIDALRCARYTWGLPPEIPYASQRRAVLP
jgi:hypothetical protein